MQGINKQAGAASRPPFLKNAAREAADAPFPNPET